MTLRERIRFYQQLAVLMRAGVSIRASIQRLKGRVHGNEVAILSQQIESGERLGEAFTAAGFSTFECQLVGAGERSAQLDSVFEHLSEFWKRQLEMQQAMIRPLYYPVVVLHLAVLLLTVVEAQITSWPLAVVHFFERMAVLYVVGTVLFVGVRFSWSNEIVRQIWLHVPVIGSALRTAYAYRWISALKMEFLAGISLPNAVADAWLASGYLDAGSFAEEGREAMRTGTALSTLVQRWKRLPRDWIDFIETGEISGGLEAAFKNLEAEAARAWTLAEQRMTDWLSKAVYFVVLLFVAAIVGSVLYKVTIAPIVDATAEIDKAVNGK